MTFKDIDMVHERPEGTARKRFNDNKEHFIKDIDFFKVYQPSEMRTLGITRPQGGVPEEITVMTESSYLMLVKSFTDDLAWKVQRCLVNSYFKVKEFSGNPCAAALAKDKIAKWKRHISSPLVERLKMLFSIELDVVKIYAYIYRQMKIDYQFDMNEFRMKYSVKYQLPLSECPVINAIADNKELRNAFVVTAHKFINQKLENKLKELEETRIFNNKIVEYACKFNEEFDDECYDENNFNCEKTVNLLE